MCTLLSQCLARPLRTLLDCVQEVLMLCTAMTRCEGVGLAVSLGLILAVSRVTGDFGRPCAVGV